MGSIDDSNEYSKGDFRRTSDYKIERLDDAFERFAATATRDLHAMRGELERDMKGLREELVRQNAELRRVSETIKLGKFAFLIITSMGGAMAAVVTQWQHVVKLFK